MADSGARGGVEQIRQLAGMRGLMAKPSGKIIETPIKANFREGLSVLEYFSSTHGARKGLADTALKTADSGYLTRKLADVAQNVVITMRRLRHLAGHHQGRRSTRARRSRSRLSQSVRGRVSRVNIVNPITDEVDRPRERDDHRRRGPQARGDADREDPGPQPDDLRGRRWASASCCYGMDLATGQLVEEGMAVGIIAAQSIGEPGTQLTMRTFHIGGVGHPRRRGEGRQVEARGQRQVRRPERRRQRRGPARSPSRATARSRSSTPRAASWRSTTSPTAR